MKLQGKIAIVTGAGEEASDGKPPWPSPRKAPLSWPSPGPRQIWMRPSDLIEEAGGSAIALSRDLTDAAQVQSMVDEVVARFGRTSTSW